MKKLLLTSACAWAVFALPVLAADLDPARIAGHVKVLASDAFEGRGPATAGEVKTVRYMTEQFRALGLKPGGDLREGKRAWTQDVPLAQFDISGPIQVGVAVNGQKQAWTQGQEIALRATQTGAAHVTVKDVPVVFVGYGVTAPERNWDDFKGVDLKGKIAIVLVNDPDFETGDGDFGGKAMTYYGRWTYKYEEAARRGAVGFIIVHETEPASYGWNTVKNSNTDTVFDIIRDDPSKTHAPIEAWVQRDTTVALFKAAGLDFEALKKQAQTRDFKPVTLEGVTFSADYAVDAKKIVSHNVAGRLPGKTHPDETVIYTAHWDHLGVGLPDARGDRIYNGAQDNALGSSTLIEIARAFARGPRPDRSVVFLSVTAEERGLLGSEYYATHPLYPLATTVGDINMDGGSTAHPAGRPDRGGQGPWQVLRAGPPAGRGQLLPVGPLLLRQAGGAGHLLRRRPGPGGWRQGPRRGARQGLCDQPLPPAGGRVLAELEPGGRRPGRRHAGGSRRKARQFPRVAGMEGGQRVQGGAGQDRGPAQIGGAGGWRRSRG
jgi:Zn-dependent M28 family amino/carboxypeptidase